MGGSTLEEKISLEDLAERIARILKKVYELSAEILEERKPDEEAQRKKEADWVAKLQKEQGLTDFQARELTRMLVHRRGVLAEFKKRHDEAPEKHRPRRHGR